MSRKELAHRKSASWTDSKLWSYTSGKSLVKDCMPPGRAGCATDISDSTGNDIATRNILLYIPSIKNTVYNVTSKMHYASYASGKRMRHVGKAMPVRRKCDLSNNYSKLKELS
ncbi:hypothetical protein AgCh_018526 [Apium graveolens]